ncbi:hypothetical protein, partial [Hyphococcus sp.]|uniref:hypothetical protein n=1 Tax=Hyphococcus sp. TaxID=2038636 RepID=UPI0037512E65
PAQLLAEMAAALAVSVKKERIDQAVSGPILRQYSKSPDHAYDVSLRNEIIAQSQSDNGDEIRKGMSWLERIAGGSSLARACLDRWS